MAFIPPSASSRMGPLQRYLFTTVRASVESALAIVLLEEEMERVRRELLETYTQNRIRILSEAMPHANERMASVLPLVTNTKTASVEKHVRVHDVPSGVSLSEHSAQESPSMEEEAQDSHDQEYEETTQVPTSTSAQHPSTKTSQEKANPTLPVEIEMPDDPMVQEEIAAMLDRDRARDAKKQRTQTTEDITENTTEEETLPTVSRIPQSFIDTPQMEGEESEDESSSEDEGGSEEGEKKDHSSSSDDSDKKKKEDSEKSSEEVSETSNQKNGDKSLSLKDEESPKKESSETENAATLESERNKDRHKKEQEQKKEQAVKAANIAKEAKAGPGSALYLWEMMGALWFDPSFYALTYVHVHYAIVHFTSGKFFGKKFEEPDGMQDVVFGVILLLEFILLLILLVLFIIIAKAFQIASSGVIRGLYELGRLLWSMPVFRMLVDLFS